MEELIKEAITNSNKITKNTCVEKITPVGGGCIHKAWCIHLQNGQRVFAKTNHISNFNMFRYEYECLLNLRKYSDESFIYIPEPLELIKYNEISILCLKWIDLAQCTQKILGQGLALLHKSSSRENKKMRKQLKHDCKAYPKNKEEFLPPIEKIEVENEKVKPMEKFF